MVLLLLLLLPGLPAAADLENQVRKLIANANLRDTTVSVLLYDLAGDTAIVGIDPDRAMTPASNMKVITTAAALDRLGATFTFSTDLDLIEPSADVTDGDNAEATPAPPDLVLRGSGDPALGDDVLLAALDLEPDDVLDRWVDAIEQTGHTEIDTLWMDDRVFDRAYVHPTWPDNQLDKWYCAQVAGINFHGNVLDILYLPTLRGEAPTVQVYPWFPRLSTVNRAVTGQHDAFWIQRDPTANRFTFGGEVRNARSEPLRTTVYDPPMFLGELLRYRLGQRGITVDRVDHPSAETPPVSGTTLYRVNTTLAGVLDRTNQDSHNLFAEALLKRLGFELTGQPGTFESGAAAVRMFLQERLGTRVQPAITKVVDGSGLSKENVTTARVLVETLRYLHRNDELRDVFRSSLAVAGETGTLRRRAKNVTGATVHAKSGYINGVSALSGYLVFADAGAPRGERVYAFSMIFNGFRPPVTNTTLKQTQDRLLEAFVDALKPEAVASY